VIIEPQRTYVLELLTALGAAADGFILAGAQAMKFTLTSSRATKDFDFVLDVVLLRRLNMPLAETLQSLGYVALPEAQYFQFEKQIPGSPEVMRVEFMAAEEYQHKGDFRVAVGDKLHARACAGGRIVLAESDYYEIKGVLPDGKPGTARVRVTRPNALVMMKCLALDDRHRNLRGPEHYEHDREEARTHAVDIVAILAAQTDLGKFRVGFFRQFEADSALRDRTFQIMKDYFGDENKPGLLLYEEYLRNKEISGETERSDIRYELRRAQKLVMHVIPD